MANRYRVQQEDESGWQNVDHEPLDRAYDAQMTALAYAYTTGQPARAVGGDFDPWFLALPSEVAFMRWCTCRLADRPRVRVNRVKMQRDA